MLAFAKSPGTKPGDLAGHRFIRSEGLEQCESMFIIFWSPSIYIRWLGARGEKQIITVSQTVGVVEYANCFSAEG